MDDKEDQVSRRAFFGAAGKTAAIGAGAVAAAVGVAPEDASAATDGDSGDYHETAHIKTYYDLARF